MAQRKDSHRRIAGLLEPAGSPPADEGYGEPDRGVHEDRDDHLAKEPQRASKSRNGAVPRVLRPRLWLFFLERARALNKRDLDRGEGGKVGQVLSLSVDAFDVLTNGTQSLLDFQEFAHLSGGTKHCNVTLLFGSHDFQASGEVGDFCRNVLTRDVLRLNVAKRTQFSHGLVELLARDSEGQRRRWSVSV